MYVKVNGVVIRETAFDERHAYLTLLTPGGPCEVLARGVRRKGSRLLPAVRLFTYSEFSLYEGKSGYRLQDARVIRSFFEISRSLDRYALGCYFAQLCQVLGEGETEAEELLFLLLTALSALTRPEREPALIKAAFEMRLMAIEGFAPAMEKCALCGGQEGLWQGAFLPQRGVVLCPACAQGGGEPGARRLPLGAGVWQAVTYVLHAPVERLFAFSVGGDTRRALGRLTQEYLLEQTGQRFSTLDFYRSLAAGEQTDKEKDKNDE